MADIMKSKKMRVKYGFPPNLVLGNMTSNM